MALLMAFFVDWDYFMIWLQRNLRSISFRLTFVSSFAVRRRLVERDFLILGVVPGSAVGTQSLRRQIVLVWATGFLIVYIATFTLRLGFLHYLYPFSNFDFFSDVHAFEPYSEHRHWVQNLGQVSLVTDNGEAFVQSAKDWLIGRYRGLDKLQIDASLKQKRELVLAAGTQELRYEEWKLLGEEERFHPPKESIREIRYWGATVHFPAYPAPPGWTTVFRGLGERMRLQLRRSVLRMARSCRRVGLVSLKGSI